ncbi:hypothetical protein MAPG_10791 [Magnaporthiopsis poae ATCC 64411]|uniref:Nephrocystin 3-like N-terminal domain-containing protein n=1 Tax=Magnaporthiopsis poae (strain ATCC 64411 / 73-15) TaxID=644358 RepID=A0A0C4EDJ1_MAGP6|nr:hypothetical protein MAPG_10791 [Magnaporthiopsis poae ATCC 64411]
MALDPDARAYDMDRKYRDLDGLYFRFTVESGLEDVKLAEPQKLSDVVTQTMAYISQPSVIAHLDRAAAALIGKDDNADPRRYDLGQLSLSNEAVIQATERQQLAPRSLQARREFCQRWFSEITGVTDPLHDLQDCLDKRFEHPGTGYSSCAWLFERSEFKETLGSTSSSIFWLKGRPGSGKSVLASVMIDNLAKAAAEAGHCPPLYYFCRQDSPQTTLRDVTCRLLAQVMEWAEEGLVDAAERFVRSHAQPGPGQPVCVDLTAALLRLLRRLLNLLKKKWIVVVDGIDGIDSDAMWRSPLHLLVSTVLGDGAKGGASLFFTSRRSIEPDLASRVSQLNPGAPTPEVREMELTTADNADDLEAFLEYRVNQPLSPLASKPQAQREEIIAAVRERADGMFLYASLVLDELKGAKIASKGAIKSTLNALPEGIFRIYERQLELVSRERMVLEVFWWIQTATRPLTWDEIRNGLAIVDGAFQEDEVIDQPKDQFVQDACGPLVELYGEGKAYLRFIHPTVRELLNQDGPGRGLQMHLAHPTIATKLLTLLNSPDAPDISAEPGGEMAEMRGRCGMSGWELHRYAVLSWYRHLKAGGPSADETLESFLSKFLGSESSLKWLVAALTTMRSSDGHRAGVYAFVEDVTDCLWSWIRGRKDGLDIQREEQVKDWSMDFLSLMLDWGSVLEREPSRIYSIHFDLLPSHNRFRRFVDAKTPQSVVRFSDLELRTRSSVKLTWQENVVAVDENRDFAYVFQQGYLLCYHTKTNLLVAEVFLGDGVCERAALAPNKGALALLVSLDPHLDQHTASHAVNLRQGLQLSTLDTKGAMIAWRLENEADEDETRALSALLLVPPLPRKVFVVRLSYQGVSRANLLGVLPGLSSFMVRAFETEIVWKVDDADYLAFSADSSLLATPTEVISLSGGAVKTKSSLPCSPHHRSSKITGDLKTWATIRHRRTLELWDVETESVRHTAQVAGVGHILDISYSGRLLLILRLQNDRHPGTAHQNASGEIKLRPQRGTVCIYDSQKSSWLDLLVLQPPASKKLAPWAFHSAPVKTRFAAEDASAMRVVVFTPDGWSATPNVRHASSLWGRRIIPGSPHLLVFESQQQGAKGGFDSPALRHIIPLPPNAGRSSRGFPKILEWSDHLNSALVSFGEGTEKVSVAELESLALRRSESVYEKGCEGAFSRVVRSGVFVACGRQTVYQLQLILRPDTDSSAPDGHPLARRPSFAFDLQIDRLGRGDNRPTRHLVENVIEAGGSLSYRAATCVSISTDERLTFGSVELQFGLPGAESGMERIDVDGTLFSRATSAFVRLCRPFHPQTSSLFEYFSAMPPKPGLGIFQRHPASLDDGGGNGEAFIPMVTRTCQRHLSVGQYSRVFGCGEEYLGVQREAQFFEVYLTVFDEHRQELSWMVNATTAGRIAEAGASSVPNVAWAMHPTQPLLAWMLPGHRVRLSHIGSSRHPLNIYTPFDLDGSAPGAFRFSPSGRYLFMRGREAICSAFLDGPSSSAGRSIAVLDLHGGYSRVVAFSSSSPLSFDIDDEAVHIYRITRENAVEWTALPLPALDRDAARRGNLTHLPSHCCCPTCGRPFQQLPKIIVQRFRDGDARVVLSHGEVRIGHGQLGIPKTEVCEPLVLRIGKLPIPAKLAGDENDKVDMRTSMHLLPAILTEHCKLDLAAFDACSKAVSRGDISNDDMGVADVLSNLFASGDPWKLDPALSTSGCLLFLAILAVIESQSDSGPAHHLLKLASRHIAEQLRRRVTRQCILKAVGDFGVGGRKEPGGDDGSGRPTAEAEAGGRVLRLRG